jgi:hypothetical protein
MQIIVISPVRENPYQHTKVLPQCSIQISFKPIAISRRFPTLNYCLVSRAMASARAIVLTAFVDLVFDPHPAAG